ncbi:MAG TPA: hypothetical protein PLC89_18905 [Haliscomenobacter sp.]|mgnify:CR=1 FL=1|uniref:hypothetical protein n=1 Tax=Haliscomenobacter sp. TaxID=2717303 RepID=UPI002CB32F6D|nr:hypothetical protein [Haliscomenobacter sp.]HOY19386.1 hypothetical protein [Haliscomenobacter sp.]HPH21731.1 hypothetical protein [Haliscomenobacter sp.]
MRRIGKRWRILVKYCQRSTLMAILFLFCTACLSKKEYSEEEIKTLMDQEVNRKITDYRNAKIKACQEDALREATRIVDSLLIVEAYFERDTLSRPPKPVKPNEDIPKIKGPDTIQLKPLFEGKKKKVKIDTLGKKNKGIQ